MGIRQTHQYGARHQLKKSAKVIAAPLCLSALGYIGVSILEHGGSSLSAVSQFMLEGQMVNSEAIPEPVELPKTSGMATAAVPASESPKSVQPAFDYFPDHYVNQATRNAEPIDTF